MASCFNGGSRYCLASAGDDIKLWDADGFILDTQFNPHDGNISCICWSPDNTVLMSTSTIGDKIVITYPDKSAFTYSLAEKEQITSLAVNSTSRYVMGGSPSGVIRIWDLKSKSLKKTYQDHKAEITTLQFNWKDSVIASGSESGEIILNDVVSGVGSSPLIVPKSQAVRKLQYSHYKKALLGSCYDSGGVYLWDTSRRQMTNCFTSFHLAPATDIAFSPLNDMLLTSVGLDKRIVCYDVNGKGAIQTMTAESPLTSIDLMHDGVTLAVGSTRGKIYIYDLRKRTDPLRTILAHKTSIQGLCFQYKKNKSNDASLDKGSMSALKSHNNNNSIKRGSHKPNGVSHPSNGDHAASDVSLSSRTNSMHSTSPAVFQSSSNAPQYDPDDIYSPIRETVIPRAPTTLIDGALDMHISLEDNKKNSLNNYADGMFSPMGEKSGDSNLSLSPTLRSSYLSGAISSLPHVDSLPLTTSDSATEATTQETIYPASIAKTLSNSHSPPTRLIPHTVQSTMSPLISVLRRDRSLSPDVRRVPKSSFSQPATAQITPTEAGPSQNEGGAMAASPAAHTQGYLTTPMTSQQPFQVQFIRNLIDDAMEEFRDEMRQDVLNLQMEMLKQFQIQQEETRMLFQQFSVNNQLLAEIERLQEENRKLKRTY